MSCRRCMPSHEIRSAARSAAALASGRSAPRPTTVSTRPPFVPYPPPGRPIEPPWNTSAPVGLGGLDAVDRQPALRRVRVALRREHDPDGRAGQDWEAAAWRPRLRAAAAAQQRPERAGEPRQDHLCLGIAEPGVALEERGSVVGQHQARVQEADERRAAPRQLREDRPVDGREDPLDRLVAEVGQRRVGTHAAGVRTQVAVAQALVVARRRQRHGFAPVADRDHARLAARTAAPRRSSAGPGPRPSRYDATCSSGQLRVVVDRDALAGGEPVLLQDHAATGRAELGHVGASRRSLVGLERARTGHPNARRLGDVVAERLGRLDPRRGPRRPERRECRPRAARRRHRPRAAPRAR